MAPTTKLRFVERLEPIRAGGLFVQKVRVLQQWWEGAEGPGEWRDVMTMPEGE